jgi:hypothetical protein
MAALPHDCPLCGQTMTEAMALDFDHEVPVAHGGWAGEGRLTHAACNRSAGARIANDRRAAKATRRLMLKVVDAAVSADVSAGQRVWHPPLFESGGAGQPRVHVRPPASRGGIGAGQGAVALAAAVGPQAAADVADEVAALPWVARLGRDEGAAWPLYLSGPHPAAVGSYGEQAEQIAADRLRIRLRWWQRLALARILEHDTEGQLVWLQYLVSAPRQVGKTWLLRVLAQFRIHRPDLFGGGPQLVMLCSSSLDKASAVMREDVLAHRAAGGIANGRQESMTIRRDDGSIWRLGALGSVHSLTINNLLLDEAFQAQPDIVRDRAEPTMLEAVSPQFGIFSTAGTVGERKATAYVPRWRETSRSIPGRLIVEWAAPDDLEGVGTLADWRAASPAWSPQREAMLTAAAMNARTAGEVATFRAQNLNIWATPAATEADRLVHPEVLAGLVTGEPVTFTEHLTFAVEDHHGRGAAVALAVMRPDGVVHVTGELFSTRSAALEYVARVVDTPGVRDLGPLVLLGASMEADPMVDDIRCSLELRGARETGRAITLYRRLVADALVEHDGDAPELLGQLGGAELRVTRDGTGFTVDRHDLAQAAVWAVAEASRIDARAAEHRPTDPREGRTA